MVQGKAGQGRSRESKMRGCKEEGWAAEQVKLAGNLGGGGSAVGGTSAEASGVRGRGHSRDYNLEQLEEGPP